MKPISISYIEYTSFRYSLRSYSSQARRTLHRYLYMIYDMDPLRSQIHIRCNTSYGLLLVAVPFCNPVGAHSPPSVGLADARDSTLSLVRPTRSSNSFLVISVMLFFLTGSVRPLVVPPRSYPVSLSCDKRRRSLRSSFLPRHSPLARSSSATPLP